MRFDKKVGHALMCEPSQVFPRGLCNEARGGHYVIEAEVEVIIAATIQMPEIKTKVLDGFRNNDLVLKYHLNITELIN